MHELRKDSEKFLEILLKKRGEKGEDAINCYMDEFAEIPNIKFNIKAILDDLKVHGCITNPVWFLLVVEWLSI